LYDNAARYGPQLSAIPHLLSRYAYSLPVFFRTKLIPDYFQGITLFTSRLLRPRTFFQFC
jgi:hypothetical protein